MFGKDRQQYTSRNVFSDDEDMEADATILEREEAYRSDIHSFFWLRVFYFFIYLVSNSHFISARIAKKEDMLAVQDEERREEEKRKRKRERERAAARGQQ
jgi:protein SPT2